MGLARGWAGALCIAAACLSASAGRTHADRDTTAIIGAGNLSCATWQGRPPNDIQVAAWIFGYWSALNFAKLNQKNVGGGPDGDGILGEVRNIRMVHPSWTIAVAALSANEAMQRDSL